MSGNTGVTYEQAGVNIAEGNQAVENYRPSIAETMKFLLGKPISKDGNFCFMVKLPNGNVLAMSCDGVGTKVKIAIALGVLNTVGIDLVAMCVNDIIVNNIRPRWFMDYYGTVGLNAELAAQVIEGIARGCIKAKCALVGGETAEMPGIYAPGDFDLVGMVVGYAENDSFIVDGRDIEPDMILYGIQSTGLHSNGYSLVRKVFGINPYDNDEARRVLETYERTLGHSLGTELLTPTKIYVNQVEDLVNNYVVHGMANITGGGFVENLPRMLPDGCALEVKLGSWPIMPIFSLIEDRGNISFEQMFRTFNNGIGFAFVSPEPDISETGIYKIGRVIAAPEKKVHFIK